MMESHQRTLPQASSEITNETKSVIFGSVAAVIAVVLTLLEEHRQRTTLPRIIKQPYVNRDRLREEVINSILNCGDSHCVGQIRMRPKAFYTLCDMLVDRGLMLDTLRISVKEQVLIFLSLVGHNLRFRIVAARFFRSTWTIHNSFHVVLKAILRMYPDFVKPPGASDQPDSFLNNPRFFPWFEDFVGAIDGTHIRVSVPTHMQERFRGRKGKTTQNVLGVVDFDLKFTYMLAGWEGSAHDSRVLTDALGKGFKIPDGKYMLADGGYGDRKGIMPPFRGIRYHLKEYTNNPPLNEKELFNLRHSSLRMCIERAFGVLKNRFRILDDAAPFIPFETQVDVVLACCVIHNYLRGVDPNDQVMREVDRAIMSGRNQPPTRREAQEETRECVMKRKAIATAMWNAYKRPRI